MPYTYVKRGGKFDVYKADEAGKPTGSTLGSHDSEGDAKKQIKTIYANENKSVEDFEIKCYSDSYVPYGINSFSEYDAYRDTVEKNEHMHEVFNAFVQISYNILGNNTIEDKTSALQQLMTEFGARITEAESMQEKGFLGIFKKKEERPPERSAMIWKDADGTYKWFGVYSNAYIDKHKDILTQDSHIDFMKAIENGEWDYPELRLWHSQYAIIGKATMMGYDPDTGFAYAGGYIEKGYEKTAEFLASYPDKGMSHGMPRTEVVRDSNDKRLIKRYRSRELSILPKSEAANELTGFYLEDTEMKFNEKARDFFEKAGFDVDHAEKQMDAQAALAKETERKEDVPSVVETPEVAPVVSEIKSEAKPVEDALTKAAFTEAMETLIKAFDADRFNPIVQMIAGLQQEVKVLTKQLEDLTKSDEEKITEKAALTPAASIAELMSKSVFGAARAAIELDGRSTLAKDTPDIAKAKDSELTPFEAVRSGINMRRVLEEKRDTHLSPTV